MPGVAIEPVGRGRYFDFFATPEEIDEALCALPDVFGPYVLVSAEFEPATREWVPWQRSAASPSGDFGPAGICRIWAKAVSPDFSLHPATSILDRAALEGMPKLSYSLPDRSGTVLETRFTMTSKHRDALTGEILVHDAYVAIYDWFAGRIKERLTWRTRMRDLHGNESPGAPMTDRARAAYDAGYPYRGRPVEWIEARVPPQ